MSSWKKKEGIAVITHTYIERGPHQITVFVGDHFNVVEATDGWLRGKNLYTGKIGIFPEVCCDFYEGTNLDQNSLLSKSNDILFIESGLTIKYALNALLKVSPAMAVQISQRIIDVVKQAELCQKHAGAHTLASHVTLSTNVDNLRQVLQLPRNPRSFFSSLATLSTWGRDVFGTSTQIVDDVSKNSSIVLHVNINVKMLKNPVVCRLILYNPNKNTFISSSVSVFLSPNYSNADLLFEELDKRDLSTKIYLCIYTYNIKTHLEGVADERKFVSFACVGLEQIQEENMGKSTTTEIQSMVSKGSIRHIMHQKVTQDPIPPQIEKNITRCTPYFQTTITPHFGITEEIVSSQNLQTYSIVPPLSLPSTISLKEKRSLLNINLSNLTLKARHSKTRFILKLIDSNTKAFTKGFESIMETSYDSTLWCSPIFNGKYDENVFETTTIDLTKTDSTFSSLYLLIQVDKIGFAESKFSPCAYGVFHITNDIGCFNQNALTSIKLYPITDVKKIKPTDFKLNQPDNAKTIGKLDIQLFYTSTLLTQDPALFKLLNYQNFKNELKNNISNFMFCGMSEWAKFTPEITLVLCEIISTIPECAQDAFNSLISMYGELLSRAGSEYSSLIYYYN
ncbi:SH3 domain containing protein [Histomonas meleagridis]|uniref:SH3 domain containing protein n=1 Tax=Histomonas meleagridis TaxID=135588 RepID=UPI003559CB8E|nr:SH3 domain containing protein [Histomonas meleagridis]KAH0806247.1 SH3 domain containing protein [Histomonas meleagridis]